MPIEEETLYTVTGDEVTRSTLVEQMINYYALKLEVGETKVTDFNEGSEIRNLLEAFAVDLYWLMEDQNELAKIAFIETAEGEYLDMHGASPLIDLERDTGQTATGFVTFTIPEQATEEIIIPGETVLVCIENGLEYVTDSEAIIDVGETETLVSATCLTEGADGNCEANTITIVDDEYLDMPELTVKNLEAFHDGTDYEEDDEYRERLLAFIRKDDFGSYPYYMDLGESVDGVHDIVLLDDPGYTKKIVVNGDVKPTPDSVLVEVLDTFTRPDNIVLNHTFTVVPPEYVDIDLTVNVVVSDVDVLSDDTISNLMTCIFDGGSSEDLNGMDFEGLYIGEPLTKSKLYSNFEMLDAVVSVSILYNGEEISEIPVNADEVLKLDNLEINKTVEE